jgi:hypothetical protein
MGKTAGSVKVLILKSLLAGFMISAGLSFFFHFGILLVYSHWSESALILSGLAVFSFMIFWINIKFDRIIDRIEIVSRTIAFDYKFSYSNFINFFSRFMRPLNPYIGALGTVSGLLFVFCAVPAVIIYLEVHPGQPEKLLTFIVSFMSAGAGTLFYFSCRNRFPSITDKVMFFGGILLGQLTAVTIFGSSPF